MSAGNLHDSDNASHYSREYNESLLSTNEYKAAVHNHLDRLIERLQNRDGDNLAKDYYSCLNTIMESYFKGEWCPANELGWIQQWNGKGYWFEDAKEQFVNGHRGDHPGKEGEKFEDFDKYVQYDGQNMPYAVVLGVKWPTLENDFLSMFSENYNIWTRVFDWMNLVIAVAQYKVFYLFDWFNIFDNEHTKWDGKTFFDNHTYLFEVMEDDFEFCNKLRLFHMEWKKICKRTYVKLQRICMYNIVDTFKDHFTMNNMDVRQNAFISKSLLYEFKFKRNDVQKYSNDIIQHEDTNVFTGEPVIHRGVARFPNSFKARANSNAQWTEYDGFFKTSQQRQDQDNFEKIFYLRAMCAFLSLVTMAKKFRTDDTEFTRELQRYHGGSEIENYSDTHGEKAYTILNQDMSFNPYLIAQ